MNILQINLNHCRLAHYLLMQAAIELKANIVFISEPLYNPGNWIYSKKGTAAVWANDLEGSKRQEDGDIIEDDFVAIKINNEIYISIYLSPNMNINEYAFRLEILSETIKEERRKGRRICIGGDFNAKSPSWGADTQNSRGNVLLDRFLEWGLSPIKPEGGHTFERGKAKSNLDFVAVSRDWTINREIRTRILDKETASDHKYLITKLRLGQEELNKESNNASFRWKVTNTGLERCVKIMNKTLRDRGLETQNTFQTKEEEIFLKLIPEICDKAFEKIIGGGGKKKKNNIWWNEEIKEQRNKANKMRRRVQKYKKRRDQEMEEVAKFLYKKAKKELQRKIVKEKEKKWRELCESINKDPWGKPYKVVMKQVKPDTPPANISMELAKKVLCELFPSDEREETLTERRKETEEIRAEKGRTEEEEPEEGIENREMPNLSEEEILEAAKKLKPNKAAGLDGVVPEIIKKLTESRPDRFAALFNGIINRGKIPQPWKKARTILLRKPGKDTATPAAYRPICVIDALAKLLEYVVRERLEKEMGEVGFDENQYGFVKGKSTIHAMVKVAEDAKQAKEKRRYGAMIALDVKNAFNSLKWDAIIEHMKKRGFSEYLIRFTQDYFKDRSICYVNSEGIIWRKMKKGVPQGSVLGPFLWNLVYDDLLKRKTPEMTNRYAFADDIIITVQAARKAVLKTRAEKMIEETSFWMKTKGLALAGQKTEVMMMNLKRFDEGFELEIEGTKIKPSTHLKYLGVTFDKKRKYAKHLEDATNKAIRTLTALSRLMANGSRTSQAVRRLFYMTIESIVLYGAPVWADAARVHHNKSLIRKTQKLGLGRIISAYRSVPQETLCVLSGVTPWLLKISERKQLFEIENRVLNKESIKKIREGAREGRNLGEIHQVLEELTLRREDIEEEEKTRKAVKTWVRRKMREVTDLIWQREWNEEVVGRWTHRLIPNIQEWRKRNCGQLDFYTTQVLTGHGVFNSFRKRIGKTESEDCWYHPGRKDTPEHTVLECEEWKEERRECMNEIQVQGSRLNMEKLIEESIKTEKNWKAFSRFCRSVLKKKEAEERRRERLEVDNPIPRDTQRDCESGDPERMRDL